jgi:uncharacterized protein (TIGR02265 family)
MATTDAAAPDYILAAFFEGLFLRGLKVDGVFREELKSIGLNLDRLELRYPPEVWHGAAQVARKHRYPELTQPEADRAMGHAFLEGYQATAIGAAVLTVALNFLPTAMLVDRTPAIVKTMYKGELARVVVLGQKHRKVHFRGRGLRPHFVAGTIEAGVLAKSKSFVTVEQHEGDAFVIDVRWE